MTTYSVNGIELHVEERGQGTPLVLLMGLGADGSLWEDHVAVYERHFRCIMVDNRGAGRSGKPEGPYSTRQMAEDTASLMAAMGLEKAHVSGISMGGAIAQQLALLCPERILSLTLNCTWSHCDGYTHSVFGMFADLYGSLPPQVFARMLNLWIFTPAYHNRNEEEMRRREAGADAPGRMPAHAFRAQCAACAAHDVRGRLDGIAIPTLVTVGSDDLLTPPRYAEELAAAIPGARLSLFAGGGHTHHWDSLDRFNRITLAFMRERDGGGTEREGDLR